MWTKPESSCVAGVASRTYSSQDVFASSIWSRAPSTERAYRFVRILCVFSNASKALEKESGVRAEPDDGAGRMLSCVSSGRWKEALDLLSSVQVRRRMYFTCLLWIG